MVQPITAAILDAALFSKLYFDPRGLIVATRDNRPIGFVHAGWGPDETQTSLDRTLGTTYMLRVLPEYWASDLPLELLARSEAYLREAGTKVLYAGPIRPFDGYYYGLYGGSEMPGVLHSDETWQHLLRDNSYEEIDQVVVMHCDMGVFRMPISRKVQQSHRRTQLLVTPGPKPQTWWEACTLGSLETTLFELFETPTTPPIGSALFWDIEPLASSWGVHAAGLLHVEIGSRFRRAGHATRLLGETLAALRDQGIGVVEAQTMHQNEPALTLFHSLGFVDVDYGSVFRKRS